MVGHRFHSQNRLSETQTDSIIEVTSVLLLVIMVVAGAGVSLALHASEERPPPYKYI